MASNHSTTRRAYRRTDDFTPGTTKIKIAEEALPLPLAATSVLIKVHAVALNYRDASISNGGNPWPVTPHGVIGNDAAGEVIAVGDQVKTLKIGDRWRRSWLAADEDGVLADYLVYDEKVLGKLPTYLDWVQASIVPCAGVTAWSALKGAEIGQSVLIQGLPDYRRRAYDVRLTKFVTGTGGVAMFAPKRARSMGLKVILSSSSDKKLKNVCDLFTEPPILTVNYATNAEWHEDVLKHTDGAGVDLIVENGGPGTLLKSMKCTRRGGTISQVGHLDRQKFDDALEIVPTLIDRRILLRGINAGSKTDMDDLCAALTATSIRFDDIIDSTWPFEKADEALQCLWEGKQIGKVVIKILD
ncbi:Zinc-type alcohol dehydrogenase-like protein [Fulvia fulva]|nr:Zinc-type alcohol dehydrogenase-like protein [Fulvia fulva]KAK4620621.1 Zinc-type alcohol dehydrogenase-like protein [Fulvia fulva]WPV17722.1 Zinc-type alcohol dehydrogenase-like protein [Fulvia fulva]WPV32081.1 Zinc-type alcohol dehydrogenase-like protein [Fulvia fulva]